MSEILFKAKRENWKEIAKEEWWCEGYLVDDGFSKPNHYFVGGIIVKPCTGAADDEWDILGIDFYEIDPETICQYVRIKDNNDEQIFENDIVLCESGEGFLGYREFKETILVDDITNYQTMMILQEAEDLTILGNKFDNPELLKWCKNVPDLKEK